MKNQLKPTLRGILGSLFSCALRAHSRIYEPSGPIVIIAPHPDDETLGCGGLMALLARKDADLRTVFLTSGEASHRGHPIITPATLGPLRRAEARAALTALGGPALAENALFLGAPDGELARLPEAAHAAVQAILVNTIRLAQPGAVLAPYPWGGSTEHTAAYELARAACASAGGAQLLGYPIWAWWQPFRLMPQLRLGADNLRLPLDASLRDAKKKALACHRSQVQPSPPWPSPLLPSALIERGLSSHEFFFREYVPPRLAPTARNP